MTRLSLFYNVTWILWFLSQIPLGVYNFLLSFVYMFMHVNLIMHICMSLPLTCNPDLPRTLKIDDPGGRQRTKLLSAN